MDKFPGGVALCFLFLTEICFRCFGCFGVFRFLVVSGVGCLGISGVGCLGCGRFWEHSRGFSLSLSPIGAGVTGPLSGPVSDRESVGRIRLCVGVLAGLSV